MVIEEKNIINNLGFHPTCKIELANGTYKFAPFIVKGDFVKIGNSNNYTIGEIEYVIENIISGPYDMIRLSKDLILTKWTSVKINNEWKIANDIGEKCYGMYFNALYNFVLKDNTEKGIIIQDFECSTVSHEMLNLRDNNGLINK